MTYTEADVELFPFITDAPCLNEFIISNETLKSPDFMEKLMEREDNEKIINALYSLRK